jgi:hypothetical protein
MELDRYGLKLHRFYFSAMPEVYATSGGGSKIRRS